MQTISDPRKYTDVYPESNIIINQALQVLNKELPLADFTATVVTFLKNKNDALLNVALNLSPSVEVSQLIWQTLNHAINVGDGDWRAYIFAIPVVLVAGSKVKAKLKASLNVESLNQFFVKNEIFTSGLDSFISAKLIDPQFLAGIKPSQFYYWVRNLHNAKLGLPIETNGSVVEVLNEGVFLRFLTGVIIEKPGDAKCSIGADLSIREKNTVSRNTGSCLKLENFNKHSMAFMKLIHDELKTAGVTLFPIPFPPIELSDAFVVGNDYRKEVAVQVAVSNIVRKLKEVALTPHAIITSENEALKLIISSKQPATLSEVSLWQLNRFDSFDKALSYITNLLYDLQVEWTYAEAS